jgi:hypothetical protein
MTLMTSIRAKAAAVLVGLSLTLSGCFISPGKFASELTLLENNQFTFTYEGEVHFLVLADWVQAEQNRNSFPFEAYCYGSEREQGEAVEAVEVPRDIVEMPAADAASDGVSAKAVPTISIAPQPSSGRRDCTAEEEAEQRAEWEAQEQFRNERERERTEQLAKLLGGVDPTDPAAEAELAKILMRQKGFDRVVTKGNGLFEVSYAISGTLNHDYMFPMMEDFPTINPFVQLFLRDGGVVRINAPGFAPQSVSNPMMPFMAAASGIGGGGRDEFAALSSIPPIDGTFTIITTGDIRANNTDEGPVVEGARKRLTWTINARSKAAPTALIAMPR